jgi:hypothetical protein
MQVARVAANLAVLDCCFPATKLPPRGADRTEQRAAVPTVLVVMVSAGYCWKLFALSVSASCLGVLDAIAKYYGF